MKSNGEGTAPYQRYDGRWQRKIWINGKRKTLTEPTHAKLDKRYKELQKEIAKGTYREKHIRTVPEHLNEWLEKSKRVSLKPRSYDTLETTIRCQIEPYFKDKQYVNVTHDDVQTFINWLVDQGKSYSMIKKAYNILNASFKSALVEEVVAKNPCFNISLPSKSSIEVKEMQVLNEDEINDYIRIAMYRYKNGKSMYQMGYALILILFTGLRLAEASGLKWSDVDFDHKKLDVHRNQLMVKNRKSESDKSYIMIEGTTKTKSSNRTIPLNNIALDALKELNKITGSCEYILSTSTGRPVTPRNMNRTHDAILIRANIKHVGIHALRHTFASLLFSRARI